MEINERSDDTRTRHWQGKPERAMVTIGFVKFVSCPNSVDVAWLQERATSRAGR
jgi:hypothetical protein